MKNISNCKIEKVYKSICDDEFRTFYWRIKPKELNLWNRLFHNPWRTFTHVVIEDLNSVYDIEDYYSDIKPITTYGEAIKYQKTQNEKARKAHEEAIKKKKNLGLLIKIKTVG